jgi:hypothetical protein
LSFRGILANSEGTQGGSVRRTIPVLKEDHSIAISFVEDNGLDAQLFDFGTQFIEPGKDHFRIRWLHGIFRSVVRVKINMHVNQIRRYREFSFS